MRIGIDIGRVIRDGDTDPGRSMFASGFFDTPKVAGAAKGVARIVVALGAANVRLASKCGERTEARMREWIAARDLLGRPAIDGANLHFCRRRPDKRVLCDGLGIHAFIDDHCMVLAHLLALDAWRACLWRFAPLPDE